jgi:ferritin-like metal-binding protein YciE
MYITNLIYTIDYLQKTLYSAERNIEQIRGQLSEIRKHITETTGHIRDIRKHIQETNDVITGQIVDQSRETINTTNQINEIYECLDVLDDRLLEVVKIMKKKETKK